MNRSRTAAFLVVCGLAAGVTQVILIRELLVACFGNEVSLGLMLAAWLVCGAAGVLAARRWRGGEPDLGHVVARAVKLALILTPAVFLAIAFVRSYPVLACVIPMKLAATFAGNARMARLLTVYLAAQPGEMLGPIHLALISLGACLGPATVTGALFSVGLKLHERALADAPAAPGQAYGLDAVGHLVGGVALGLAVAVVANTFAVVALVGLGVSLAALGLGGSPARPLAAGSLALVLLAASPWVSRATGGLLWRQLKLTVLAEASSVHGRNAVVKSGEGIVLYENGSPTGTSPGLPDVERLVHFALLQHPRPERVLLIGGGSTGGVQEALKHNPRHVDYVELDPALLRLAREWVSPEDKRALRDPRAETLTGDGRRVVKQAAAGRRPKYDAIISLLPDPTTALLNRFYTREWFGEARAALNPGGVLAWQMASSRHYFRPSLLLMDQSIFSAAGAVFPKQALMMGEDSADVAVGDQGSELSESADVLLQRLERRRVSAPIFEALASDGFDRAAQAFVRDKLAHSPPAAPDRDLAPIGYFYNQAVWIGFYSPDLEALYVSLGRLSLRRLLWPALALLAVLLVAGVRPRGRAMYVPLAILMTGSLGMALELCLLFAFQASFGYVYQQVGIIIGAFMVGLAGGAALVARAAGKARGRAAAWLLVATQLGMGLVALALPALLGAVGRGSGGAVAGLIFSLVTALVGLGVGVQFPLASLAGRGEETSATVAAERGQARRAAGLYAADLLGASVGAATAGAVFIPVLGVAQTCLAAALLSGGMAVLLAARAACR